MMISFPCAGAWRLKSEAGPFFLAQMIDVARSTFGPEKEVVQNQAEPVHSPASGRRSRWASVLSTHSSRLHSSSSQKSR